MHQYRIANCHQCNPDKIMSVRIAGSELLIDVFESIANHEKAADTGEFQTEPTL